jgi:hypothetical protein
MSYLQMLVRSREVVSEVGKGVAVQKNEHYHCVLCSVF